MFINKGTDKDAVHIYNGILLNHKKEQNYAIRRDVDGPRDWHTQWSKSAIEKQALYNITCDFTDEAICQTKRETQT